MSARSALFAIKLEDLQRISTEEAAEFVECGAREIAERFRDPTEYETQVLRHIFGLAKIEGDESESVALPFRWVCATFGTRIFEDYLPPIYELEIYSPLEDYVPPFGLPARDECVASMNLETIIAERERLDGCDTEALKYEGADVVLEARKMFLKALDVCIEQKTDMVVIES